MFSCKEKQKSWRKQYYKDNKEKAKEYNKEWREKNPEKVKRHHKDWCEKNPEKRKKYRELYDWKYYKNNKTKKDKQSRDWYKKNPDKRSVIAKRYNDKHKLEKRANYLAMKHYPDEKPCVICGSTENIERHHQDYNYPLEITWLCRTHHRFLHVVYDMNIKV